VDVETVIAFIGGLLWFAIACGIFVRVGRTNRLLEQMLVRDPNAPRGASGVTEVAPRPPLSNAQIAVRLVVVLAIVGVLAFALFSSAHK
jgi:hypothetical protein